MVLPSYALETQPHLAIEPFASLETISNSKKKAIIFSKLQILPTPSKKLPCETGQDYSQNFCLIQLGWQKRFEEMAKFYGSDFYCKIPGSWTFPEHDLPVCEHYSKLGNKSGLMDLTRRHFAVVRDDSVQLINFPPIGTYR